MRLALVCSLFLVFPYSVSAGDFAATATSSVSILSAPGASSTIVADIPQGADITVRYCDIDAMRWCSVVAGNVVGYVDGSSVTTRAGGAVQTVSDYYATYWVSLKSRPSGAMQQLLVASAEADGTWARYDRNQVVAWGDSMTMGYGAKVSYPMAASQMLNAEVKNMGIGGQTSTAIASRQGALPIELGPKKGLIPPFGSVDIITRAIVGVDGVGPLTKGGRQEISGKLGGVSGILRRSPDDIYTFTRIGSGPAVPCMPACAFVPTETYDNRTQWIWAGRNGVAGRRTIYEDIAAMVERAPEGRFLVAGFTTSSEQTPSSVQNLLGANEKLRALYGDKYVDLMAVLMVAGDGSEGDAEDLAQGFVPRSLRVDSVHLTNAGYALVAKAFVEAHKANGY